MVKDFDNVPFGEIMTMAVPERFLHTKPSIGMVIVEPGVRATTRSAAYMGSSSIGSAASIAMACRHHNYSIADPFPKPREYNELDAAKLRKVVIALRKPPPSLLYISVVTMADILQLPNFKAIKGSSPKTGDMVTTEIPCRKVLDDKEKKKRKAEAKATANAPGVDTQAERVVRDKGAGREGARKKKKVRLGTLTKLNSKHHGCYAKLDRRACYSSSIVNVGEAVMGGEGVQENVNDVFANESLGDKEGGLNLETVEKPVHDKQASTLLRFGGLLEDHANLFYAHESCKDVKARYKKCKKELEKVQSAYDEKVSTHEALRQSEADAHQLILDRKNMLLRLSMGEAFSLAIGKCFIDGISIGRKDLDIQTILKATPNVNPASSDIMETCEQLFDKRYLYVDKVACMYLLDPSGLQNVMPDKTGPTPGGGLAIL
nr:hypothetical protein [Tanacetum cinerariifolium]